MKIEIEKIVLKTPPGAHIDVMVQAALQKCAETKCDVEFKHNAATFTVEYENIYLQVVT